VNEVKRPVHKEGGSIGRVEKNLPPGGDYGRQEVPERREGQVIFWGGTFEKKEKDGERGKGEMRRSLIVKGRCHGCKDCSTKRGNESKGGGGGGGGFSKDPVLLSHLSEGCRGKKKGPTWKNRPRINARSPFLRMFKFKEL